MNGRKGVRRCKLVLHIVEIRIIFYVLVYALFAPYNKKCKK
jgi:hypothetical protein